MKSFSENWWQQFVLAWNSRTLEFESCDLGKLIIGIGDRDRLLSFDRNGKLLIKNNHHSHDVPRISGSEKAWDSVISGKLSVEKAIFTGELNYSGDMTYLTHNWPSLSIIVEVATALVDDSILESTPITLTDVMICIENAKNAASSLSDFLGMKMKVENEYIELVQEETGQKVVIARGELPCRGLTLACSTPNIAKALESAKCIFADGIDEIVEKGLYAQIRLVNSLQILLYEK